MIGEIYADALAGESAEIEYVDGTRVMLETARWFEPIDAAIGAGDSLATILRWCREHFALLAPDVAAWQIEVHQFRIEAAPGAPGQPTPEGLHREILFVHDLWLPQEFKPVNQDGEVAEIRRMPLEEVTQSLLEGDFTLDAGAVMIDGLLRQGAVIPEDPQYLDLQRLLKP
jgi:hypothetical protein